MKKHVCFAVVIILYHFLGRCNGNILIIIELFCDLLQDKLICTSTFHIWHYY